MVMALEVVEVGNDTLRTKILVEFHGFENKGFRAILTGK
jgi:hypothetical protein